MLPSPELLPTQMLYKYDLPCLSFITVFCVSPSQLRAFLVCENGALVHFVARNTRNVVDIPSTYSLSLL